MNITGLKFKDIYKSILTFSDALGLTTTPKSVGDGNGNNSPLQLSTNLVNIVGTGVGQVVKVYSPSESSDLSTNAMTFSNSIVTDGLRLGVAVGSGIIYSPSQLRLNCVNGVYLGSSPVSQYAYFGSSGNIIGNGAIVSSAKLQIESTTQGFLPPRMTGAQADVLAAASPAQGLMIFVTSTSATFTAIGWWGFDGTIWVQL